MRLVGESPEDHLLSVERYLVQIITIALVNKACFSLSSLSLHTRALPLHNDWRRYLFYFFLILHPVNHVRPIWYPHHLTHLKPKIMSSSTLSQVIAYPVCMGIFGEECNNVAYIHCNSEECEPMCESCAERHHYVLAFRHHTMFKGTGIPCMLAPITNCNQIATCKCIRCDNLLACQECMRKRHHKRPAHTAIVRKFANPMYPTPFRHAERTDKPYTKQQPSNETTSTSKELQYYLIQSAV